jgi:hypothetical protein
MSLPPRLADIALLATTMLLCACPAPGDPSDGDSTDQPATEASSGGGETTDVTPTTGATSSAEPTSTSEASTTGAGADDGCAAYCAKLVECDAAGASDCMSWCPSAGRGYEYIGDGCLALYAASNGCVADLSCEQLADDPKACQDQEDAIIGEACTTKYCRDLCDKSAECQGGPGGDIPCSSECSLAAAASFSQSGAACTDLIEALIACELTLTCAELEPLQGCEAEIAAMMAGC